MLWARKRMCIKFLGALMLKWILFLYVSFDCQALTVSVNAVHLILILFEVDGDGEIRMQSSNTGFKVIFELFGHIIVNDMKVFELRLIEQVHEKG